MGDDPVSVLLPQSSPAEDLDPSTSVQKLDFRPCPGACCDVPSHLYSFSFERRSDWSRKFAPQAEIQAYLRHCVDKYRLRPHIRFGTEISGARLDEAKDVVRPEAQERFNEEIQAALADSAWATNCGSWYKTASGKITNNWKGFTL